MTPESKERITLIMTATRVAFYYGFIPTVVILGFMKGADEGNPPLSLLSCLPPFSMPMLRIHFLDTCTAVNLFVTGWILQLKFSELRPILLLVVAVDVLSVTSLSYHQACLQMSVLFREYASGFVQFFWSFHEVITE